MAWFKIRNQQVILRILAKPNAKKTALIGIADQGLQISLHAKPQQGEANKELISYLAKLFKIPKSQMTIEKGETNRYKQVIVPLTGIIQELLNDPTQFMVVIEKSAKFR